MKARACGLIAKKSGVDMLKPRLRYTLAITAAVPGIAASAATLTVNTDGSADYQHIQDAVDAAVDGDIIEIVDGTTYTDTDGDGWVVDLPSHMGLTFKPDVEDGMIQIDGEGSAGGIELRFSSISVEGIWFLDCTRDDGGGMYSLASDAEIVDVTNCIFENCHATDSTGKGGALYLQGASSSGPIDATVTNCLFSGCSTTEWGGAIYASDSTLSVDNVEFSECSAEDGAAIHTRGVSLDITSSHFIDNEWIGNSGSIVDLYLGTESADISNCQFSGNKPASATLRGQVIRRQYGDLSIDTCSFTDNVDLHWGCIRLRNLDLTDTASIAGSQFSSNTTDGTSGTSCIAIDSGADLTLASVQMCDHDANTEISGSYTDGGSPDLGNWCCPGDIDEDGDVDADDLSACIDGWSLGLGSDDREDVDRNGSVAVMDVLTILSAWGACP